MYLLIVTHTHTHVYIYMTCDLIRAAVWQFVVDIRAMCPRRTGGFSAGGRPATARTPAPTSSAAPSATPVSPASAWTRPATSSTAAGTTGPTAASSAAAWYGERVSEGGESNEDYDF